MKNVGILTWITYENYGTFLQCYALNKNIAKLDYNVETIQYIPRRTPNSMITLEFNSVIKYYFNRFIYHFFTKKPAPLLYEAMPERHKRFSLFKTNYINLTEEIFTSSQLFKLNDKYDYFVCGSDQIWSPLVFDSHFFLDFVTNKNKKIAYAPSIGTNTINNAFIKQKIKELINDFDKVSIRENSGKQIIKELTGKDVPVVLDPTMLLDSTEWDELADNDYCVPEKYILCYFLGYNEKYWKQIKQLSEKTNIPIVVLPVYNNDFLRSEYVPKDVGPSQFITLVRNATFICTDSFHGSVFSILYKKPFALFSRFTKRDAWNQNSRIDTLCENLKLKERRVTKYQTLLAIFEKTIDWYEPYLELEKLRKESNSYLHSSFNNTDTDGFNITNTCCGCGACAAVCPKNAITIRQNEEGFLQSFIDKSKCIKCKSCRMVCPFYTISSKKITENDLLYAANSIDLEVLKHSSSGGIGYELMDYFKKQNNSVTGCKYDKNTLKAIGISVSNKDIKDFDLTEFQGSKYIQSDYTGVFKRLKDLTGGIITGLPCQIAAAHNYLCKIGRRDEFFLVDIICHGVPSQVLWEKYITECKKKFNFKDNPEIIFRNKKLGWVQRFISLASDSKEINISSKKDLFYSFFLSGNCYAVSCYECNYRDSSCADIRIADYWNPKYYKTNSNGLSMCIPLTAKGKELLIKLQEANKINCELTDIQDMFRYQQTEDNFIPFERKEVIAAFKSNINLMKIKDKYLSVYNLQNKIGKVGACLIKIKKIIKK